MTTGTVTDAWPVAAGQTWSSDYGALALPGLRVTFCLARSAISGTIAAFFRHRASLLAAVRDSSERPFRMQRLMIVSLALALAACATPSAPDHTAQKPGRKRIPDRQPHPRSRSGVVVADDDRQSFCVTPSLAAI